jgi:curved DNA-binding protein CbpA
VQHPDKCPNDPEAKEKFQALSIVHATLTDEEKRKVYDETGALVDDDSLEHTDKEW